MNIMRCELGPSKSRARSLRGFRLLLVSLVAALTIVACGGNGDAESHYEQGRDYSDDRFFEQAIDEFDASLRIDPEYADAYASRGTAYFRLGEYAQALADYDAALRINPDEAMFYVSRGAVYSGSEEYDRAIADYDAALRINPIADDAVGRIRQPGQCLRSVGGIRASLCRLRRRRSHRP